MKKFAITIIPKDEFSDPMSYTDEWEYLPVDDYCFEENWLKFIYPDGRKQFVNRDIIKHVLINDIEQ